MFTGPETLLRQSSYLGGTVRGEGFFEGNNGDAIEAHEWKCVRTLNGTFLLTLIDHCGLIFYRFMHDLSPLGALSEFPL